MKDNSLFFLFLACQLLLLSKKQQPMIQLALDMLKRLGNVDEQILDILLENNLIIEGLQFCIDRLPITITIARKFLGAALPSEEIESSITPQQKIIYFTVYKFFDEYFQKTTTIGTNPFSQTIDLKEPYDEIEMYRQKFISFFRNQETDVKAFQ